MAYNALAQLEMQDSSDEDHRGDRHEQPITSSSPSPEAFPRRLSFRPLSLSLDDFDGDLLMETPSRGDPTASTASSYDMLDSEDASPEGRREGSPLSIAGPAKFKDAAQNRVPRFRQEYDGSGMPGGNGMFVQQRSASPVPMIRTSSEGSVHLRHPAPGLQSLQGAYVGNVDRLERSAERLSMTSDVGEEIRRMRREQKRSTSAASSVHATPIDEELPLGCSNRQFSFANSIINVNAAARLGNHHANEKVTSPRGSIHSGSASQRERIRSVSRGQRPPQLPEPGLEGRPLDFHASNGQPSVLTAPVPPLHANRSQERGEEFSDMLEDQQPFHPGHNPDGVGAGAQKQYSNDADRPRTSASTDTYQQATSAFTDFDGVHYIPRDPSIREEPSRNSSRRLSLVRPPLAGRPESYVSPIPDESMVYYPAPVPMMLNLPKRLSKLPNVTHREKRQTQMMGSLPPTARKSATWLPGVDENEDANGLPEERNSVLAKKMVDARRSKNNLAGMPPQLRASTFFDRPSVRQDVEVKEDSAVATLDSILDASARAPVSAFTDHPIVGQVGAQIYRKEPGRKEAGRRAAGGDPSTIKPNARQIRSSLNLFRALGSSNEVEERVKPPSKSSLTDKVDFDRRSYENDGLAVGEEEHLGESTPLRNSYEKSPSIHGTENNLADGESGEFPDNSREDEDDHSDEDEPEYIGQPTTLLAELQLRQHEQKQRNRTAATAFPNGMHSTLLELDAVAQVQKNSRKQKRVALAWEDPVNEQNSDDEDNDDVPLGVLYPGNEKKGRFDDDRVLGLLEKRDMEDNEPLSRRRARLTGKSTRAQESSPVRRTKSPFQLDVPGVTDEANDDEEETLAQRIRRLKSQERPTTGGGTRRVSSDFASELISQFGGEADKEKIASTGDVPTTEETLGQRRQRLRAEREGQPDRSDGLATAAPPLKQRHSMADILQAHPATGGAWQSSQGLYPSRPGPGLINQSNPLYTPRIQSTGAMAMPGFAGYPTGFPTVGTGFNGYPFAPNALQGNTVTYANPMMNASMAGFGNAGMSYGMGAAPISIDPRQRDMIDRWRQSVQP
ncbi:MAG: hypothetical protein M1833_004546 [Piccolia ochrophora]|nr:MAG: hypothetical protein M1833_004546 [Piccolia ochrophora]